MFNFGIFEPPELVGGYLVRPTMRAKLIAARRSAAVQDDGVAACSRRTSAFAQACSRIRLVA
jgi:hypothetical protein